MKKIRYSEICHSRKEDAQMINWKNAERQMQKRRTRRSYFSYSGRRSQNNKYGYIRRKKGSKRDTEVKGKARRARQQKYWEETFCDDMQVRNINAKLEYIQKLLRDAM